MAICSLISYDDDDDDVDVDVDVDDVDVDVDDDDDDNNPWHNIAPPMDSVLMNRLTHWGRATHICVGKQTTIGPDNGLSPGQHQAIIWTIAGILLIGPLGTNFSEILIGIQAFSFKKMHLKMSSAKWRPFVSASMC